MDNAYKKIHISTHARLWHYNEIRNEIYILYYPLFWKHSGKLIQNELLDKS